MILTHGFEEARLHRISATIVTKNAPSKRAVETLGLVHEGIERDDEFTDGEYVDRGVSAVLADDWLT